MTLATVDLDIHDLATWRKSRDMRDSSRHFGERLLNAVSVSTERSSPFL